MFFYHDIGRTIIFMTVAYIQTEFRTAAAVGEEWQRYIGEHRLKMISPKLLSFLGILDTPHLAGARSI